VTADDLPAALANLPMAWRDRLSKWGAASAAEVVDRIRAVSGDRPIAPADPLRALRLVAPDDVRVVVIGQDPYPTPGQADGLAFSAERSTRPSLRRIFDVLEADRPGWKRPLSGRLDAWAAQGVLLLNPALSVEIGRKESHLDVGWQALTSSVVEVLLKSSAPPVCLLWGAKAQQFFEASRPAGTALRVLRTRHPSNDFQRGFMADGSHFAATAGLVNWWGL
jgi:uracil-DNA glycosylase